MTIVQLPYPIQLINGNVADGGQVQSDLNYVASQVNANAAKNGVNNDITALTALISISPGPTITGGTFNNPTIIGGTITGTAIDATSTVPTAPVGTNTNQIASTAFVAATAFSAALPAQTGNAGKIITTNGSVASWSTIGAAYQFLRVNSLGTQVVGFYVVNPAQYANANGL